MAMIHKSRAKKPIAVGKLVLSRVHQTTQRNASFDLMIAGAETPLGASTFWRFMLTDAEMARVVEFYNEQKDAKP